MKNIVFDVKQASGKNPTIVFYIDGKRKQRSVNCSLSDAILVASELNNALCGNYIVSNEDAKRIWSEYNSMTHHSDDLEVCEQLIKEYEEELSIANETIRKQCEYISLLQNKIAVRESSSENPLSKLTEEEKYYIITSLKEYYNMRYSGISEYSRRKEVIEMIMSSNPVDENKERELYEKVFDIFKDICKETKPSIVRRFKQIGFTVEFQRGTHLKIYPEGRPQLACFFASTPSDLRNANNCARIVVNKIFR